MWKAELEMLKIKWLYRFLNPSSLRKNCMSTVGGPTLLLLSHLITREMY